MFKSRYDEFHNRSILEDAEKNKKKYVNFVEVCVRVFFFRVVNSPMRAKGDEKM